MQLNERERILEQQERVLKSELNEKKSKCNAFAFVAVMSTLKLS